MTAPVSLFNTLTRRVEPLAPPRVTLYTGGPTVWNYAHIGNFRTFLFEDLLRRWLEYSSYDVFQIMNLTDVDDRTIRAARAAGKRLTEHTAPFTQAFFEDRDYLRIKPAHVYPAATKYMPQMIALVSKLLERGVAYKGEDGSVYFADEALEAAKEGVRRLGEFHERLKRDAGRGKGDGEVAALAEKLEADVATALNDDLNAPRAVAALFDFVRAANRELDKPVVPAGTARALAAFQRVAGVLDVLPTARAADAALVRWVEERIA